MEDEKKALKIIQDISTATKLTAQKIQRFAKDEYVMSRVRNAEMPTPLDKKLNENLLKIATILATTKHACIIDEQVTVDTKRLIRTPYSLHGKTGLIAMPITIEELEGFAPLTDAITFRNEETKIIATKECFGTLKGEKIKLKKDGISTVHEYHAVYFMCRNQAELI